MTTIMSVTSALCLNAVELVDKMRTEIVIFIIAICFHAALFGGHRVGASGKKRKSGEKLSSDTPSNASPAINATPVRNAASPRSASLIRAAEKMVNAGFSPADMASEIQVQLAAIKSTNDVSSLAGMLEGIGRGASADLLSAVRITLSQREILCDARLGELLLRGYFAMGLNSEFHETLEEVEAAARKMDEAVSPCIRVLAMKAAVRTLDMDQALERFRGLAGSWDQTQSPFAIRGLQQLVRLASQKNALPQLMKECSEAGLVGESLNTVVMELAHTGPASLCRDAESLVKGSFKALSPAAIAALVTGYGTLEDAERVFKQVMASCSVTPEVITAVMGIATGLREEGGNALVELVLAKLPSNPPPAVVAALIRFYAGKKSAAKETPKNSRTSSPDSNSKEQQVKEMAGLSLEISQAVIDLYESHFAEVSLACDPGAERIVIDAALRCQRKDFVSKTVAAMADNNRQQAMIKSLGAERRLQDAIMVFRACQDQNSSLYNALLDACVECKDTDAAEQIMSEAVKLGKADVVTYNTLVKAHVRTGKLKRAQNTMEVMRSQGMPPNRVTFNELLDAAMGDRPEGAWSVVEKMQACGLKPNHITCSILLKSVQPGAKSVNIERTMEVVDNMEDEMDDVLLSSVVEACIRVGRADLLMPRLKRQRSSQKVQIRNAHTYGSIIRAYGFVRDQEGVWDTWKEMRMRRISPTSVTLGCMVEALVTNGDPDSGYDLIREIQGEEKSRSVINAVIYGTVLKGFSHQKKFGRVWAVYQEMLAEKMEFSIVTYNTLVDACARCGEVGRVPTLLEDMDRHNVEPNLITYSAILKGYCQDGKLDKAFELLASMRQTTKFKPDEIMFNSLLDGCARQGLWERGIALLEEMEQVSIRPSNFTLSILVKLASRSKRLDAAFDLSAAIATKYRFKLNVHVFSNLVHACVNHKDLPRAVGVLERMLRERVRPDVRTYSLLLKGLIAAGQRREAGAILRAALGLPEPHEQLAGFSPSICKPEGGVPKALVSEVLEGIVGPGGKDEVTAVRLLQDIKRQGMSVDPKVQLKLATRASNMNVN